MNFAVVGSGAVGGYYGGRLAAAGEEVHFLFRSDYDVVACNGLSVKSCDGDFHVPARVLRAYARVEDMPKADVVIVAVKASSTPALGHLLPPLMHNKSVVACLQNGLGNEEFIAGIGEPDHRLSLLTPIGEARVIAGSAFICCEREAPGMIVHTAAGTLKLGWLGASPADAPSLETSEILKTPESPETIARVFMHAGVKCGIDSQGKRVKWSKLIWNVPFNGLSVYYGGMTTDVIMADTDKRDFALRLMEEVITAASEDGVVLDRALIETNMRATEKMGAYRTSMMVDFLNRRPLEVETILGEPLRRGQARGKRLPAMEEVYRMVKSFDFGF